MSIELLQKSIALFASELDKTADSDFGKATKCDGWDVTALLRHVVGGATAATMALRGATREENAPVFANFQFGSDIRGEYAAAVADHIKAFQEFGDLEAVVQHPMMDMPAGRMLMFRITDFTLHAWDLGAGLGREVTIEPALLEYCYANTAPLFPALSGSGLFGEGPSGTVPETADLQTRLIDLTGRR